MNLAQIVQSILTYICTAGFVGACGYAAALSKRVTVLEQKVEFIDRCYTQTAKSTADQIKEILDVVNAISTRLTKLETKLEVKLERNHSENND